MIETLALAKFPIKFHSFLERASADSELSEVISWLPCGKAFKIHDPDALADDVLPVHFPSMKSFKSFRRQLNIYGIKKRLKSRLVSRPSWDASSTPRRNHNTSLLGRGKEEEGDFVVGSYYHQLFQRNRKDLAAKMERVPVDSERSRGVKKRKQKMNEEERDQQRRWSPLGGSSLTYYHRLEEDSSTAPPAAPEETTTTTGTRLTAKGKQSSCTINNSTGEEFRVSNRTTRTGLIVHSPLVYSPSAACKSIVVEEIAGPPPFAPSSSGRTTNGGIMMTRGVRPFHDDSAKKKSDSSIHQYSSRRCGHSSYPPPPPQEEQRIIERTPPPYYSSSHAAAYLTTSRGTAPENILAPPSVEEEYDCCSPSSSEKIDQADIDREIIKTFLLVVDHEDTTNKVVILGGSFRPCY